MLIKVLFGRYVDPKGDPRPFVLSAIDSELADDNPPLWFHKCRVARETELGEDPTVDAKYFESMVIEVEVDETAIFE